MKNQQDVRDRYDIKRRRSILINIKYYSKLLVPLVIICLFLINMLAGKAITTTSICVFSSYVFILGSAIFASEKQLFKGFEDYIGCIIYVLTIALKIWLDSANSSTKILYSYPKFTTQAFNLYAWIFIRDPKKEILMCFLEKVFSLLFKFYSDCSLDVADIADDFASFVIFCHFSYIIEKTTFSFFSNFSESVENALTDLTKGMGSISENLCILSLKDSNKLGLYQCSKEFLKNYYCKNNTNFNDVDVQKFLQKFKLVTRQQPYKGNKHYSEELVREVPLYRTSDNLLNDVNNYLREQSSMPPQSFSNAYKVEDNTHLDKAMKISKVSFYAVSSVNDSYDYFEIKYVLYKSKLIDHEETFILMLFNHTTLESLQSKNDQLTTLGNILVSSLTNELKNPLNGLNGQIFVINKENAENLAQHEKIKRYITEKQRRAENLNLPRSDTFQEVQPRRIKSAIKRKFSSSDFVTNLLCKYMNTDHSLRTHLDFSKFLRNKMNLIVENFEIYSKLKLKQLFNLKFNENNLMYILRKSLKMLNPIVQLNNNKLKLNVEIANFCSVRVDLRVVRTLLSNIILMLEKQSKHSLITVTVDLLKFDKINNSNTQNSPRSVNINANLDNISSVLHEENVKPIISVKFTLDNFLSTAGIKNDDRSPFNTNRAELVSIFSSNNARLAQLIDVDYLERCDEEKRTMEYELIFHIFNYNETVSSTLTFSSKETSFMSSTDIPQRENHERVSLSVSRRGSFANIAPLIQSKRIMSHNNLRESSFPRQLPLKSSQSGYGLSKFYSPNMKEKETNFEELEMEEHTNINFDMRRISHYSIKSNQQVMEGRRKEDEFFLLTQDSLRKVSTCDCIKVILISSDPHFLSTFTNVLKQRRILSNSAENVASAMDSLVAMSKTDCPQCYGACNGNQAKRLSVLVNAYDVDTGIIISEFKREVFKINSSVDWKVFKVGFSAEEHLDSLSYFVGSKGSVEYDGNIGRENIRDLFDIRIS